MSIHGHTAPITTLLDAAHGPRMHHAWLFTGPEGVGKASIAKAAAARLLAESAGPMPEEHGLDLSSDHRIAHLIASGAHSDFIWLERLLNDKTEKRARNISVDQVRAMSVKFSLAPSHSKRRIVVIDAIDDMEKSAANALLKSLEEPPKHTIFFLISHAPGRLLPTIRSRCRVLRFAPLGDENMRAALRAHLPEADPHELAALITAGEGAPGKALALAGLDIAGIDAALGTIARTGDPSNTARAALANQLSLKAALPRYEAFLKRAPSFLAAQARTRTGAPLNHALEAYAQANQIAATAPIHNLDPQSAVFEICGLVATLAPR
jgi:DNA polymerase-3 subunit delta'